MLDLQSKISTSSIQDRDFINRLNNLDLEPIIFRIMHMEETRWSLETADRVAQIYRGFLFLVWKYPGKVIVPNKAVDQFWHQHILDTEKYHQDCYEVFGYFLHHFPYFGMRGEADTQDLNAAFQETLALLKEQFGDADILRNIKASDCLFSAKPSNCLFPDMEANSSENQASDCLFLMKASDCLFTNSTTHAMDNKPTECLFSTKPSDCLFDNSTTHGMDNNSSNSLTKKQSCVDMSRPRPIRK